MKKCLWDTMIIIELWFLQFSTNKQANKQSSVIHRFILHAALLGHHKLAHADDQRFLFPLKKLTEGWIETEVGYWLTDFQPETWESESQHLTWVRQSYIRAPTILPEPRSETVANANVTINTSEKNVSRKTTRASKFSTYASCVLGSRILEGVSLMPLDKVQSSTAELFCFSAARNHFTVHVISNVATEFFAETCSVQ